MIRRVLPLLLILMFGTLFAMLLLNPAADESSGIKQLPRLSLRTQANDMIMLPVAGQPAVINVFASWCVPCAAEMPLLSKLKENGFPIYGIAYKDRPEALNAFLQRYGDPFASIALDDGTAATQLGITGVPESYLVDAQGRIVRHMAGALDEAQLAVWQAEMAAWK